MWFERVWRRKEKCLTERGYESKVVGKNIYDRPVFRLLDEIG